MASRSKRGRSTTRKAPWDSLNPANWTATQLREKLEEMGVHMPQGMTKATLKSVYLENVGRDRSRPASGRRGSHARGRAVMDAPVTTVPIVNNVMDSGEYNSNVERSNSRDGTSSAEELHSSAEQPQSASNCSATTDYIPARQQELMTSTTNMAAPTMQEFMTAMQAMQQTVSGLQQTVKGLIDHQSANSNTTPSVPSGDYTPQSFSSGEFSFANPTTTGGYRLPTTEFGVPLEALPHIDIVPEKMKKKIWEGHDINLAQLLMPKYETSRETDDRDSSIHVSVNEIEDPRLSKTLTISEFITAFGKYKRIMCQKFPQRRVELDRYEANIIEISNVYGGKFYDYHCQFSARAAAAFKDRIAKVDWSVRDNGLLAMIVGNTKVNACQLCNLTSHQTTFCPQQRYKRSIFLGNGKQNVTPQNKDTDRYGRPKTKVNGREVCNNFNIGKCARGENCNFFHVCLNCKSTNHGADTCKGQKQNKPGSGTSNPTH